MQRWLGRLYLAGAFFMAGSSVVAGRFLSGKLGIFSITAISLFLALLPLLAINGQNLLSTLPCLSPDRYFSLLIQATCGIFLFRVFLLKALNYTSAGEAGILTGASPALTALMAGLFLKEAMYKARVLSIASTVAGIMLIQGWLTPGQELSQEHLWGNMMVLAAACCESTFNVLSRYSQVRVQLNSAEEINSIQQTVIVTGIALLLCLLPAYNEHPAALLTSLGYREWLALSWYGLAVTALGYILWYAGIKRCEASSAAAFSGLMPFTSLLLSSLLLGENAGLQQWLGGAMVVLGMILANLKDRVFN